MGGSVLAVAVTAVRPRRMAMVLIIFVVFLSILFPSLRGGAAMIRFFFDTSSVIFEKNRKIKIKNEKVQKGGTSRLRKCACEPRRGRSYARVRE